MKLLLYCTKSKPLLWDNRSFKKYMEEKGIEEPSFITSNDMQTSFVADLLNGKIVAECDFEVEEIKELGGGEGLLFYTKTLDCLEIVKKACLKTEELADYLYKEYEDSKGYAIYIKNLNIFDKPRELDYYTIVKKDDTFVGWHLEQLKKAPQSMMRIITRQEEDVSAKWVYHKFFNACIELDKGFREKVLISIRPEWLCKILNGEKTIECRKRVLKEMMPK